MDRVRWRALSVRIQLLWPVLQLKTKIFVIIHFLLTFQTPLISILVLVSAQNGGIVSTPVGGLLGLAFEALASTKAVPFWQALVNANQLSAPEMSFWLARDTAAELTNSNTNALLPGGTFTLGGVNSSLFSGEIDFVNMPSANPNTFWLLSLSSKHFVWTKCSLSVHLIYILERSHGQWFSSGNHDWRSGCYRYRDHSHRRTWRWCWSYLQ